MGYYANKVVKAAIAEQGYLEKRSPKLLEFKTKNAGYNNYTKYGQYFGMNGVYWCAEFACYPFYKAFGKDGAEHVLYGKWSAACEILRQRFISRSAYYQTPKVGDLIFFKGSRHAGANHIGIVIDVTPYAIYTMEGNTSGSSGVVDNGGCVAKKCYSRGYSHILGFGRPRYDKMKKNEVHVAVVKKDKATKKKTVMKRVVKKKTPKKAKHSTRTVTAKHGLRLRSSCSTKSRIIAVMPYGTVAGVIAVGKHWTKLVYKGKVGYAYNDYLKK